MTNDELQTADGGGGEPPFANVQAVDCTLLALLALGVLALGLTHAAMVFLGVYWAGVAAVGVFVLWFSLMPTTCMNGGLVFSLVAMAVLCNTIGVVVAAAIRFVISLFS